MISEYSRGSLEDFIYFSFEVLDHRKKSTVTTEDALGVAQCKKS